MAVIKSLHSFNYPVNSCSGKTQVVYTLVLSLGCKGNKIQCSFILAGPQKILSFELKDQITLELVLCKG